VHLDFDWAVWGKFGDYLFVQVDRVDVRTLILGFMKMKWFLGVSLILLVTSAFAVEKIIREFPMKYQSADFVVPAGETWKLIWNSPYKSGDVTPSYDVRIKAGSALIGEKGATQVTAFSTKNDGLLDISATKLKSIIWLDAGTKFEIANDLLKIKVDVYKSE
jgi:hypothetical protein